MRRCCANSRGGVGSALDGAMQAPGLRWGWGKGAISSLTQLGTLGTEIKTGGARYVYRGNSCMNLIDVGNFSLIEFKAHCMGGNTCLVLQVWPSTHGWGALRPQEQNYYYSSGKWTFFQLSSKSLP